MITKKKKENCKYYRKNKSWGIIVNKGYFPCADCKRRDLCYRTNLLDNFEPKEENCKEMEEETK